MCDNRPAPAPLPAPLAAPLSAALLAVLGGLAACTGVRAKLPESAPPVADTAPPDTESLETGTPETGHTDSSQDTSPDTDVGHSGDSDTHTETGAPDTGTEIEEVYTSPDALPCTALAEAVEIGTVEDSTLDEISGVVVSRRDPDILWVHEDHLGEPAVYALNTLGDTVAVLTLDGATNRDWEDLAIGPCGDDTCIFVGEIGNNSGDRTDLGVYVLPEPDLDTALDGVIETSDWVWYGMSYPEINENAEALAVTSAGLPVILTKHYEGEDANVYKYPALDEVEAVTLEALGTISTGLEGIGGAAALTAADLWPDDSRIIVRTYSSVFEFELIDGVEAIGTTAGTALPGAGEPHGEAIAYDPWRGGFWQVSEGVNPSIWYIGCAD